MAGVLRRPAGQQRSEPGPLRDAEAVGPGAAAAGGTPPLVALQRLHQHHRARGRAWFPPGDEEIERKIRRAIRWNAAIMVSKANRKGLEVGGHIATYASAASLYEVGYNHFFRGKDHPGGGDHIFVQGTRPPASTPARTCSAGCPPRTSTGSARSIPGGARTPACPPIRTPARCRPSGSSRRCRWASAR